jgi:hypothetical protein
MSARLATFHAQIIVLQKAGRWHLRTNGLESESFPERSKAIRAAIDQAQERGKNGVPTQVLAQVGASGVLAVEWTYGHDPFPRVLRRRQRMRA